MNMRRFLLTTLFSLGAVSPLLAEGQVLPPGDKEPLLRLEAGGPTSFVTALAFSPDGKQLYVGGWDKVVRVWSLNEHGQFVPSPVAYRVPIGPGLSGAINCIALSPDGSLLAIAGRGVFREEAGFRVPGLIVPSLGGLDPDRLRDEGMIYLFDTRTQAVRLLRGHMGVVLSLVFAPAGPETPPVLVSAAVEKDKEDKNQGVLRVWNAASGETLASKAGLPYQDVRPGLAVQRLGEGPKDIQVSIAWSDSKLRVWNLANDKLEENSEGGHNVAVVRLDDQKLISGNLTGADGTLKVWHWSDTGLELEKAKAVFPTNNSTYFLPRAISLVPSRANPKPDFTAVVLRVYRQGTPDQYRLSLVNLDSFGVAKEVSLWKGAAAQPVLAASSQGYLAVAGNGDHNVQIYSIKNLLDNQNEPQIIHSVGSTFRYVSFVTKGKNLGLLLSETTQKKMGQAAREPQQGDLIFDFGKQPLTGDIREWTTSAPEAGGWRVRLSVVDGRHLLSIFQGQDLVREIKMAKDFVVTDYALLPSRPPLDTPILAVASHNRGQPMLQLYNGKSGEQLRQLTGHSDPISCLTFSADGRLLASVAEDQTVCVWSLTNLNDILGKRGQLAGLAVKDQKGSVVVGKIHDDSPAQGKLAVDQVIEGLVENKKLRAFKNPGDFYFTIAKFTPETKVTLRVRGKDGVRDVIIPVSQGIDERKPLFSLFVTQNDRQWVGWNPIGRFESSGPKAERYIGWHFNTGEAEGPTRFALAEEYHKKYFQPGVLKDLVRIDQGEIKKLPPPPPPPAPKIGLFIDEDGLKPDESTERDAQGQLRLQHAKATLRVSIIGRALDTLKTVTWKMDDAAEQNVDLTQVAGQEIPVSLVLRRGVHRVRVTAKTPEGPAEYSESVTMSYQPKAPILTYAGANAVLVKEPNFNLRAQLQNSDSGEPTQLTIRQKANDKIVLKETKSYEPYKESLDISQPLKLERGSNLVEITAVNQGASGEGAEAETSRAVVEINYFKDAGPPIIALRCVLPAAEGASQEKPANIEPGRPIQVHIPAIRILGEIKTSEDEDLVDAKWALGKEEPKKLSTFQEMKKTLPIDEKVELRPGSQIFRFLAKTATSPQEERSVTIDYQPLIPVVSLILPHSGEAIVGEKELTSIDLHAALGASKDRQPFQAKILVNGRELDIPATIDETNRTVTAKNVPLKPGMNQLRVKLVNEWGSTSSSEEASVRYVRPPRILDLKAEPPKEGVSVASLETRVFSPTPLLRDSIKLTVNDMERTANVEIPNEPAVGNVWTLRLTNVPLEANALTPTTNKIQLRVSNQEADCKEPASTQVVYSPKQPPPVVEFIRPSDNISVTRPDFKVPLQVQSKSALEQVKLLYENHPAVSVDVFKAEKQADGSYMLTAEVPLRLEPKVNTLRIEAVNKGGVQDSRPLEINYLYRPVRVAIESLESTEPGSKPMKPEVNAGGQVVFAPVADNEVRLQGKVLWDEADDDRLQKAKLVRVYVNGFQQFPAELKPAAAEQRVRAFETTLLLNQAQANRVEIALPDLEKDAGNRMRFEVDCRKPQQRQRLHLLMVSTQEKDEDLLKDQMLQTFRQAAFNPVTPYGPLVGSDVEFKYVNHQLQRIKHSIRATKNRVNEVVVLYYRGGEGLSADGGLPQATLGAGARVSSYSGMTCDNIVASLGDTPGAQLLLLDVDRDLPKEEQAAQNKLISWGEYYPRVGMVHYAWLGPPGAPKDPGLIRALQQAMAQSTRLVEVTTGVGKIASTSDFKKFLAYDAYLPRDLESLPVR